MKAALTSAGIPSARENLVIVTHGWDGLFAGTHANLDAFVGLADGVLSFLAKDPAEAAKWDVRVLNWDVLAQGSIGDPYGARENAKVIGGCIGDVLSGASYKHMHLIAHSAGTTLVEAVSRKVKDGKSEPTVQLTLLDAFLPGDLSKTGTTFGAKADFVDHYLRTDRWADRNNPLRPQSRFLEETDRPLAGACNIDVTRITNVAGVDEPHGGPIAFYTASIGKGGPSGAWGFGKSKEVTGSAPPHSCGDAKASVLNRLDNNGKIVETPAAEKVLESIERFLRGIPSSKVAGTTTAGSILRPTESLFELITGSPVGAGFGIESGADVNAIRFSYRFVSDSPAQAYATLAIDGTVIWEGREDEDSRSAPTIVTALLPDIAAGPHKMEFHLEAIGSETSSAAVEISDLSTVLLSLPAEGGAPLPPNTGQGTVTPAEGLSPTLGLTIVGLAMISLVVTAFLGVRRHR